MINWPSNELLLEALKRPGAEIFQIKRVPNHPQPNTWAVTVDHNYDNSTTYFVTVEGNLLEGNLIELLTAQENIDGSA
jgi:hypothetical protein